MNASVGEGELIVHHDVNLGIAVDLDFEGLMVPVIHGAEDKRLRAIARGDRRPGRPGPDQEALGRRHHRRHLHHHQPGPYGTLIQLPIINQPQVAILSTDGVSGGRWWSPTPTAARPSPSTRWATSRWPGTTGPSTAPTPPPSCAEVKEILETRDWEAELGLMAAP